MYRAVAQRVAVGRAIVREPAAFLFDEPLSNLDAKLRVTTRAELKRLHQRLKTTTIYVTHDQEEAMTLGDRIVVMHNGLIQQAQTPLETYNKPVNRFVAGFIGMPPMNFFEGAVKVDNGQMTFEEGKLSSSASGGELTLPGNGFKLSVPPELRQMLEPAVGRQVVLEERRPEHMSLKPVSEAAAGCALTVNVSVVEPLGNVMDVYMETSLHPIKSSRGSGRSRWLPADAAGRCLCRPAQGAFFRARSDRDEFELQSGGCEQSGRRPKRAGPCICISNSMSPVSRQAPPPRGSGEEAGESPLQLRLETVGRRLVASFV